MRKKYLTIYFILITLISILLTQNTSAAVHGNIRSVADYNRTEDGSSDLKVYSDYRIGFGHWSVLFDPRLGRYSYTLSYRDYLRRSEGLQPKLTNYRFNTKLFPLSPFSLSLSTQKKKTEYEETESKTNDMTEEIDTINKDTSISLSTPLLFGVHFRSKVSKENNFDITKEKKDNENLNYNLSLSKRLKFGSFMRTNLNTKYENSINKNLIEGTKSEKTNKSISVNNSLPNNIFSLSDIDGKYSIEDEKQEREIEYNLKTDWQPLKSLKTKVNYKKRVNQKKLAENNFKTIETANTKKMIFRSKPYPILSLDGGITEYSSNQKNGSTSNRLITNLNCDFSLWDNLPIKLDIIDSRSKKINDVMIDQPNTKKTTKLNLGTEFGFYNINSNFDISNGRNKNLSDGQIFKSKYTKLKLRNNFDFYNIDSRLNISNEWHQSDGNEESSERNSKLSLKNEFPTLSFGNFNLNSNYKQTLKWDVRQDESGKYEINTNNQRVGAGLNYQRYLTNNLHFKGSTNFNSDLKHFEYNPNYNLMLKYNPYRNLRLNLGVNGYQQEEKINDEGKRIQRAQHYQYWRGKVNYFMKQSDLKVSLIQKNDFEKNTQNLEIEAKYSRERLNLRLSINKEKFNNIPQSKSIGLEGSYQYRNIVLDLGVNWNKLNDNLHVKTSLIRYF